MTVFKIDADAMNAAILAVSTEETRYYLNGVCIDPKGFLVSTNGHVLFAAADEGATGLDMIVPLAALLAAKKGKGAEYEIEHMGGENWRLTRGAVSALFSPIDGTFPDWRRVVPECPAKETPAHIAPAYYGALGKMASIADGKGGAKPSNAFRLFQDATGPCPVVFQAQPTWLAVVMPVRQSEAVFDRAKLLKVEAAEQALAA